MTGKAQGRYGETNGRSRLTEEQVYVIRALWKEWGWYNSEIAAKFNVSRETVRDVVTRRTWQHI